MARKRSRAAGDERAAAGDEQLDFQQEFEFMTGRPWPRNWTVAPAAAPAAAPMVEVEAGSPAAAPAAAPAAHEQVAAARVPHPCAHNAARPHPELYERLVRETPGTVIAQLMSGCLEELLDAFDIKRPTAGNEQEAMAMCAELEKLDVPTVCGVFENKTGYRFLDFTHGTTTTAQSERYSGFMKDWHLQPEDGWRAFHGTSAEQAEVVCNDQIPVSRGPLGEGGYVHLHLADALFHSPCDDQGVVTVVYGFAQTSDIIDGMPNLRVSELWGKNNNGMPIMATDDITATTFCLKAPDLQFKPCGTMRFAVCGEPADDAQTSYFHFSTWKRIVQQFPAWRGRQSAARQARFAQMRTLHTLEPQ